MPKKVDDTIENEESSKPTRKPTTKKRTSSLKEEKINDKPAKIEKSDKSSKKSTTATNRTRKSKSTSKKANEEKAVEEVVSKKRTTKNTKTSQGVKNNKSAGKTTKIQKKETKKIEKSEQIKRSKKKDEKIKQIIKEQIENIDKIGQIPEIKEEPKKAKEKSKKPFDKEKISAEIENAIKMPKKEKKNIHKTVLDNIGIAILVLAYFACIYFGFKNVASKTFIEDMKIFSMATVIIAIIMFEYSYNKENGKTALIGVEILVIAILTLVITYINILYQEKIPIMIISIIGAGAIYYLIKIIVAYVKEKEKWKDGISDIKQIIKEDSK